MKFTAAFVAAALPFLVAGAAIEKPITIPLAKRATRDGLAPRMELERIHAKYQRGFEAYKRNKNVEHPLAKKAKFTKRAVGNDPLTDADQELWYGAISVGTPAVRYTVDFDTGSSDLFLPSSSCGSTCSGHTKYNPSSSSTSAALGKSFTLSYGDGSNVSGKQYTDTVSIAGLTATRQTLGSATTYSTGFQSSEFPADGLMGMGFQAISDYNAKPLFQNLVSQGKTTSPVFAFKLAQSGSELTIGGTDSSKYTGSFAYTDVTQEGYWQVTIDSANVGSTRISSNIDAIIDSGTTLIIGDSSTISAIVKKLPGVESAASTAGEGSYSFPCSTTLPSTVSLSFGGKAFTISGSSLNAGPIDSSGSQCLFGMVADDSQGFWIVGDVFMSNVYTVFDYGNERVGFANLA